jgi:hypothetical protein
MKPARLFAFSRSARRPAGGVHRNGRVRVAALLAALLLGSLPAAHAQVLAQGLAQGLAHGLGDARYRIAVADDRERFSGTTQVAAAFDAMGWERWGADRLRLEVGVFEDGENTRPFLSLGPVWHRPLGSSPYFAELSVSPTLIGGSTFQDEELGGNFHFTSAVVLGARFSDHGFVALRLQHTSNGGLRETNPGMDMLGISFAFTGE